jgi:hypothetical protein
MLAPADRPSLSLSGGQVANGTTEFTVSQHGGVFVVGNHAVVFPARSICDPATSSYGDGEWDAPCTPLKRAIKITARISTVNGTRAVDFSPSLRFVPSAEPSRWVWIFMYTPEARGAQDLSQFNILFAPALGSTPVNDAALDPTLRTYVDTRLGVSSRRIKHFTGYVVTTGFTCDVNSDACGGSGTPTP